MIRKVHCLFEQSGTFKNEFKKFGINAEDYDILNEFGQTDHQIDLFKEIRGGYDGEPSIFDDMTQDDLILAFFPCTRFEASVQTWFAGNNYSQKDWSNQRKLEYELVLHRELSELYEMLTKMTIIVYRKNLRMVIENPESQPHYLTRYWCIKPTIIDKNRRENGDYYEKSTQYWFINFEPMQNFIFEPLEYVPKRRICVEGSKTQRSMIHPQYANRFIKMYLLEEYDTNNYWKGVKNEQS